MSISPAYNPVSTINKFLRERNIPQEFFAGVVGVSAGTMSEYLSGKRTNQKEAEWLNTIKVIDELMERVKPLHLNLHPRLAKEFRTILRDFENRQLLVSVVDLGPTSSVSDDVARKASDLEQAMRALSGQD